MSELDVNGARLWYSVTGEGEAIVCIGGMALVSNQFGQHKCPTCAKARKRRVGITYLLFHVRVGN